MRGCWSVLVVCLTACSQELEGNCQTYQEPTGLSCDTIDLCCAEDESTCWYESGGTQYECASPFDCDAAAFAVVCDSCMIGEGEAATSACAFQDLL